MIRSLYSLGLALCLAFTSANAQFDYETFFRINGQESIDAAGNSQVISLEGGMTYSGELLLRDNGDALLRSLEDGGGEGFAVGYLSSNISLAIDGGTSSLSNVITAQDTNFPQGPNSMRGFSLNGRPITDRGAFGLETIVGTFDFTFDPVLNATITPALGPGLIDNNNKIGTALGQATDIDNLIDFRAATIINTTAVPEPSSFLLLGVSGVACTLRRRRR